MFFNKKKKLVKELILLAEDLGARREDVINSLDYLKHREYGLSFDTIVTQIYEYEIEINMDFYLLIQEISKILEINPNDYDYLKGLIKEGDEISDSTKKKISDLINQLPPNWS